MVETAVLFLSIYKHLYDCLLKLFEVVLKLKTLTHTIPISIANICSPSDHHLYYILIDPKLFYSFHVKITKKT